MTAKVMAFGEALIDFLSNGAVAPGETETFTKFPGGAPANVAVAEVVAPGEEQNVVVLSADTETVEQGSLINESQTEEQLHSFKFDQKRRVRSGEIHYFDHPLMGMLIQIRRSPEEQTNASAEPEPTDNQAEPAVAEEASPSESSELTSEQASNSATSAS
mgnify:CR=1 FL=1